MQKAIFFWIIVSQFVISFIITILGLIGQVTISDGFLKSLVSVLILEQAAAVIAIFRSTDFFDSKTALNGEAWDLLATLWKYQRERFPNDPTTRWQLKINPISQDFTEFAIGFSRLRHLNLIDIDQDYNVRLSNKGYQLCQNDEPKLKRRKRLFYIG
jgi:hypothetical protein